MKRETFVAARARILSELQLLGWSVVTFNTRKMREMEVPHATSPDGKKRLWFKKQAVYWSVGALTDFGEARSMHTEIRGLSGAQLAAYTPNCKEV